MDATSVHTGLGIPGRGIILGLGAQKAGTTWLHDWLSRHARVVAGPIKELHYFDRCLEEGAIGKAVRRRALALARKNGHKDRISQIKRLEVLCDTQDPDHKSYLDLLTSGLKPSQYALDVTPEYGLVPDHVFSEMARLPNAYAIYLMREPVARHWSGLRMKARRLQREGESYEDAARRTLDEDLGNLSSPAFLRSDYAAVLDKLERHFAPDRRLVLFYEDLFTQETANRIAAFLGLVARPVAHVGVKNEGVTATMRPDQEDRLVARLRPQYEAVLRRFASDVPEAWHLRFSKGAVAGQMEMGQRFTA